MNECERERRERLDMHRKMVLVTKCDAQFLSAATRMITTEDFIANSKYNIGKEVLVKSV